MANGYTDSLSVTNKAGQPAPAGYLFAPDGSLVSSKKVIRTFDLNTNNIKQSGETRQFTITGDKGAVFSLQVTNEDNSYYNFGTGLFQTDVSKLNNITLAGGSYNGSIKFPAVSDADSYNFYLFAEPNYDTIHNDYVEVKRLDESIDINLSSGSRSNLVQKIIYQTLDITVTIAGYSPNSTVTGASTSLTVTTSAEKTVTKIPFSLVFTVSSSRTLTINRQPNIGDLLAVHSVTVGAAPIEIDGEDIYPAISNTDTVNGNFTAGTTHKIVMDTNVADKMAVGDKITTATVLRTTNGDFNFNIPYIDGSLKIVLTGDVTDVASVGDRFTISDHSSGGFVGQKDPMEIINNYTFIVKEIDPDGDNANEFSVEIEGTQPTSDVDTVVTIGSGTRLQFSSRVNRELVTVGALNPDTDNAKEFSMIDSSGSNKNVGFRDGVTLSFSNQRNYRWPVSNIHNLWEGLRAIKSTTFTNPPTIKEYVKQTTYFEGQPNEYSVVESRVPGIQKDETNAVYSRNATTNIETITQAGNLTFSEQALLSFASDTLNLMAKGSSDIEALTGYDVEVSDLKVALTEITTTTTSAVSNSTSVPVAARDGIIDTISTVTGIGIDPLVASPTVSSGAGSVTGAGTLVLSAAQTLEKGITLTFPGAGSVATISGNIKLNKVGDKNVTLYFDLEDILTMH